ncbi:ATP-binding cassette domain-containing protein [Deinococcus sp. HMF7620]|uniref:ATP-binding cassette domain-containing protein n=1 Tax=Deinococcus arboris TaxID=2682977 RepID=A0A7C9LNG0_9DEIO|nr:MULTISPECIES: ABC transporter ATP-binding protein [Deinococcus]MBZ9753118.1 ABC transporter ATP-binding protein [Deinococcus betulae]MVN88958.1 ATP-binding cassette domain-containing protein [Deinococcus arboris]
MTTTMNRSVPAVSSAVRGGAPLQLDGVVYRYHGKQASGAGVGPLSLQVAAGEFLCVVGPSGSGKSTLLSLLAGFLRPQSGKISLGGEAVRGPHPRLTLVQQEAALFPWLTVAGNVAFGLRGVSGQEKKARVAEALRQVNLAGYEGRRPHELSGGQRQRVALARALVTQPGLLLLDEPFSALDHATRTALADELLSLWRQAGVTVVFVTHQLDEALHLGQRIVALHDGEVALDTLATQTSLPELQGLFKV